MNSFIGLVDCNQFYVSCERAFNPSLEGKPVIVLSNNDGCTVSCSAEAKKIGIPVGVPVFKYRKEIEQHGVVMSSSNYALYSDMSERIMKILSTYPCEIEVYSIDEAFLRFSSSIKEQIKSIAQKIRREVRQKTGIPVSIGVSRSKTLSKIANRLAKKDFSFQGVSLLWDREEIRRTLSSTQVGDVWGIGEKYSSWLIKQNVLTAFDFSCLSDPWIQRKMTMKGVATAWELRGTPCFSFGDIRQNNKEITCSLSFGRSVEDLSEMKEAIARHVLNATLRLRAQKAVAMGVGVFIRNNPFTAQHPYANYFPVFNSVPSDDPFIFIHLSFQALSNIYLPGIAYAKAGITLLEVSPKEYAPPSLFEDNPTKMASNEALIKAMDLINQRFGKDTVRPACMNNKISWDIKREHLSKSYTTSWEDLPEC